MVCTVTMSILSLNCGGNFSLRLYLSAPIFIFTYLSQKILPPSDYKKPLKYMELLNDVVVDRKSDVNKNRVNKLSENIERTLNCEILNTGWWLMVLGS